MFSSVSTELNPIESCRRELKSTTAKRTSAKLKDLEHSSRRAAETTSRLVQDASGYKKHLEAVIVVKFYKANISEGS